VVNVCGTVGAGTAGLLHTGLRAALDSALLLIAANLAEAVLADACALEVLTGIHRRAVLAGKVFLVVAPDPRARETMRSPGWTGHCWSSPPSPTSAPGTAAPAPSQMTGASSRADEPQQVPSRDAAARGSPAGPSTMPSKAT
jgi:hypothetical protein